MSDGPWETTIALLGLTGIGAYALYRGSIDIAYIAVTALAAYLGAKVIARPHPQPP